MFYISTGDKVIDVAAALTLHRLGIHNGEPSTVGYNIASYVEQSCINNKVLTKCIAGIVLSIEKGILNFAVSTSASKKSSMMAIDTEEAVLDLLVASGEMRDIPQQKVKINYTLIKRRVAHLVDNGRSVPF